MTLATLSNTPMYAGTVLYPALPRKILSHRGLRLIGAENHSGRPNKTSIMEWVIPILALIGTAGAMWFVVTNGWFQLCGFWAL
jgi:hypothetical protein